MNQSNTKSSITIGRSHDNDIVVGKSDVSGYHATLSLEKGVYCFTDHSRNGTKINGKVICGRQIRVYHADSILLAKKYPLDWDQVDLYLQPVPDDTEVQVGMKHDGPSPVPIIDDSLGFWMGVLCFLFPIVGIILYFVCRDKTPNRASTALQVSLISVGLNFVIGFLSAL